MNKIFRYVFFLMLLLHLLPIVLVPNFMTHDGPCHTYNSAILHDLFAGKETLRAQMHSLNTFPEPNLSGHYLMAGLMFIISPLASEKVLLCLYVLLFAFGCRYLFRQLSPNYNVFSLLCFPFIYNVVFYYGFYNFILGFAASLWFFALFLKWHGSLNAQKLLALCLLSVFIYFSHLLTFLFCGFFAGLLLVVLLILRQDTVREFFQKMLMLLLLFLPGIAMSVAYFLSQGGGHASYNDYSFAKRIGGLLFHAEPISFMAYSEGTYIKFCLAILVVIFVLALFKRERKRKEPLLLLLCVIFSLVLYAVVPDALSGGSIIVPRIGLYFFVFVLAFGAMMNPGKGIYVLVAFYSVSAIALLVFRWQISLRVSGAVDDFMTVSDKIRKESVFFTIKTDPMVVLPDGFELHTQMFLTYYVDARLALKTGSVTARNYEVADASERSYFPVRWQKGFESGRLVSHQLGEKKTEVIDFEGYNRNRSRQLDYILLYSEPGGGWLDTLNRFVPSGYQLVQGLPSSYQRLYQRSR